MFAASFAFQIVTKFKCSHNIVCDKSPWNNECIGECIGDDLVQDIAKGSWPRLCDLLRSLLLWDQHNRGMILILSSFSSTQFGLHRERYQVKGPLQGILVSLIAEQIELIPVYKNIPQ